MKSVSKNKIISPRPQIIQNNSYYQSNYPYQKFNIPQPQNRRYTQIPSMSYHHLPNPNLTKPASRQSRLTNFKSQNPINRKRSLTPGSKINHIAQFQARFRQIETILNKKNQTLINQNDFLKQEIKKLYQRQSKHKSHIKKLKQQVKFLKLQCQIYQGRYAQLKDYITQVINRMSVTNVNQNNYNELVQNCSKDLIQKLRSELYESQSNNNTDQLMHQNDLQNFNNFDKEVKQFYQGKDKDMTKKITYFDKKKSKNYNQTSESHSNQQEILHNTNNKFLEDLGSDDVQEVYQNAEIKIDRIEGDSDLQQTRFIKQNKNFDKYNKGQFVEMKKLDKRFSGNNASKHIKSVNSKGLPPLYPSNSYSQPSYNDSSNPSNQASDCKTIDRMIRNYSNTSQIQQIERIQQNENKKILHQLQQDTSESNYPNIIYQQIQQLTDQSQALMYQLKKTGNQDKQLKKKIIRISQKIRQLKMNKCFKDQNVNNSLNTQTNLNHSKYNFDSSNTKYTSLQNIVPRQ